MPGVTLTDTYTAGGEVLMGTLRWEKEGAERVAKEVARSGRASSSASGSTPRRPSSQVRVKSLQVELEAKQVEKALLERSTKSRDGRAVASAHANARIARRG